MQARLRALYVWMIDSSSTLPVIPPTAGLTPPSPQSSPTLPQIPPIVGPPVDIASTHPIEVDSFPCLEFDIDEASNIIEVEAPTVATELPPVDFASETVLEAETLLSPHVHVASAPGGAYEVRQSLAERPHGSVLLCWDSERQRKVIVKMRRLGTLRPAQRELIEARLLREADIGKNFEDPRIPTTIDLWRAGDNKLFWVRDFAPGESVATHLRQNGPMPAHQALRVFEQIVRALNVVHDAGVVHRDLHPEHVVLGPEGEVRLIGFGWARVPQSALTSPGALIGVPGYISPEIALGRIPEPASDQFAAGTLLFELLTGWRPFADGDFYRAMRRVIEEDTPSLRNCGVNVPPSVERLVRRLHEKKPGNRYLDPRELVDDVRRARVHVS